MMIMGKYLAIAPAMAALLLSAACSNDDSVEGTDENVGGTDGLVELRLTSSIEAQSRTTHNLDTQIATGETVHVWVDDAGLTEEAELYEDNAMTVADGGSLTGGDAMYFPSTGNTVNIYAIHGNLEYTDFWEESVTHTVAQDQQSSVTDAGAGYAVSDLVYCERDDVGRTTSAVELTFKHLLSKVEVVLKQGDGNPGIAKAEIINTQLQAEFTPTKENGVSAAATGDAGENAIVIDCDLSDDSSTALNEGIIVPQTLSEGTAFIRITTDEGGELYYTTSAETVFEAGKKYRYTITVSLTGLDVTTSVDDWTDEGNTDGEAEMVDYIISTDTDGTRTYTVYTEAGLLAWSEYTRDGNWSTNCTLGANITLTSSWTSVGDDSNNYAGTFDGSGYTISGLTISATSNNQGLIGYLGSGGEVKNLTLTDVNITSSRTFTGGAVGYNCGTVTNCRLASGTLEGYNTVGGVVGYNSGSVTACSAKGTISSSWCAGGVVGYNDGGSITACYSTAAVTASTLYAGGVTSTSYGPVTACYATGTVEEEGDNSSGGLVEVVGTFGNNIGSVSTCYWQSSTNDSYATYVDGETVTWEIACTAMNEALTNGGYSWKYVENTDEETSENEPLILASTATE